MVKGWTGTLCAKFHKCIVEEREREMNREKPAIGAKIVGENLTKRDSGKRRWLV